MQKAFVTAVVVLLTVMGTFAAPVAQAYTAPAIWVGSPVVGTWGLNNNAGMTPAGGHHTLGKASPQNHWAVDLASIPSGNRNVHLYVAASDPKYDSRITTKVTQIVDNHACYYGGGGDFVTVGIYFDGKLYGYATYAHIARASALYTGRTVSRWGGLLGQVSWLPEADSPTGGANCWTGPHLHFELKGVGHYACWNKEYSPGYGVARTNFLGFVSGPLSPSSKGPCP